MTIYWLFSIIWVSVPVVSGEMKVVDLTWNLGHSTVFWPGGPGFNFSILLREIIGSYWYESNWFSTAEHGGTHLDSPSHFYRGKWRVQDIPPHRLIGPGIVIDVKSKVKDNPDYRLIPADLSDFEDAHGRIPDGAIVIMNSGWSSRFPDVRQVFNTNEPDKPETFHFPGFHEDTIKWLAANRNISMVGVDTPSVDYGQSKDFKVHIAAGMNNIPGLENVANIDEIPVKGATIIVGVVKLKDGSGGPARILATFDPEGDNCRPTSGSDNQVGMATITFYLALIAHLRPLVNM